MLENLKSIANGVFGKEAQIDRILALPITELRIELKKAFRAKSFTQEQYEDFLNRLASVPDANIAEQRKLAEKTIQSGGVDSSLDINLSTPAQQLLWAATLTRMMQLAEKPIVHSQIWNQLLETSAAHDEMIRTGRIIYASLQNDDTSVSWGQPGTWFYHDPDKNHINLDFYFTLLTGFEHVRAANLHEIGHSELSNKYSPRMKELFDYLEKYKDPVTKALKLPPAMTVEEQKELALVAKEWELRFDFWHMVEDNCVNQFAVNTSQSYQQDFGYSMNNLGTVIQGLGELARGDKEDIQLSSHAPKAPTKEEQKKLDEMKDKIQKKIEFISRPLTDKEIEKIAKGEISVEIAEKMFNQIKQAVWLSFYEQNHMFTGSEKAWNRMRIFPQDIRATVDISTAPANGKNPFDYLTDLAAGPHGINTMQPQKKDRFFGAEKYRAKVAATTDERVKVMDHIWDLYLDKFAKILMQQFKDEMDQKPGQEGDQGQPGDGQPGEGAPGKDGKPQEGQEGGKPGDGEGQSQSGGSGSQSGQSQPKPLSESLKDKIKNMQASPEDKRKSERDGGNDNEGQGDGQDKKDPNGGGGGDKDDQKDPNGGGGDQDDQKNKDKGGGKGWDQDPSAEKDKGQKVGDLKNKDIIGDLTDEQKEAMKEAAKAAKQNKSSMSLGAGVTRDLDLSKLAKGDWNDFHRRVMELSPIINSVAEVLIKIRNEQKKQVMLQSKSLDFMAEDGDFQGRLDRDKMLETKYRQATRAPMTGDDFKKFQEDKAHVDESTIEVYLMIDGSGSMPAMVLTDNTTAMEAALQSAVITYMACRKAGIDAYIMMWGDMDPVIVARPDSKLKEVGETLETLRHGTGSGTSLAPALKKSILEMAMHHNKNGTISGSSHVQVFSDGDIADAAAAQKALETMARYGKNLTVDVAVLRPAAERGHQTQMESAIGSVVNSSRSDVISVMRGDDANQIPRELSRTMLRRVKHIEIKTEPDSIKRKRLKKLHRKMN